MTHTAIQSKDYIKNIDFEYVETYSFQQQAYYSDATRNTVEISWYDNRITDLNGNLDSSSEKISSFQRNSQDMIKLNHILETEVANLPSWMCLPIYRDAIIFYSKNGEIVSALNVCFECSYMENDKGININADESTYGLLKSFLTSKGHKIRS
ncbi:hypothetical protein ASU31_06150 [Pedobacter ginsenosidimutans]|uniref:Uncharacterized protein n=1 Tax=Pedobacter ginsenosidimutans TaxID=687842 RepID=A0A0T5VU36_9SPHI|nr:hypothetical protein [Pedobacter ginsenosidimutans]KRT17247.1 hypothetical protein ASU31_06150 [Pedobacter ginsenosidimutans]